MKVMPVRFTDGLNVGLRENRKSRTAKGFGPSHFMASTDGEKCGRNMSGGGSQPRVGAWT